MLAAAAGRARPTVPTRLTAALARARATLHVARRRDFLHAVRRGAASFPRRVVAAARCSERFLIRGPRVFRWAAKRFRVRLGPRQGGRGALPLDRGRPRTAGPRSVGGHAVRADRRDRLVARPAVPAPTGPRSRAPISTPTTAITTKSHMGRPLPRRGGARSLLPAAAGGTVPCSGALVHTSAARRALECTSGGDRNGLVATGSQAVGPRERVVDGVTGKDRVELSADRVVIAVVPSQGHRQVGLPEQQAVVVQLDHHGGEIAAGLRLDPQTVHVDAERRRPGDPDLIMGCTRCHLKQKPQAADLGLCLVGVARGGGLEPPTTGPEPVVLPITPPPNGQRAMSAGPAVRPSGTAVRAVDSGPVPAPTA